MVLFPRKQKKNIDDMKNNKSIMDRNLYIFFRDNNLLLNSIEME